MFESWQFSVGVQGEWEEARPRKSVEDGPGGYRNYNYNFSCYYSSPAYSTELGADTSEQFK